MNLYKGNLHRCPPHRGYLYFMLNGVPASCQKSALDELLDLKAVAGIAQRWLGTSDGFAL